MRYKIPLTQVMLPLTIFGAGVVLVLAALALNGAGPLGGGLGGGTPAPLAEATSTLPPAIVQITAATPTPLPPTLTPTFAPPTVTPTPFVARVALGTVKLRLRQTPGTAGEIITEIPELTSLYIIGRTADNRWLEVALDSGQRGWVAAEYVELVGDLNVLGVTGAAENASGTGGIPYISGISARARDIYLAGQANGKKSFVFSVIGDSNSANPAFLAPYDWGNYNLGGYTSLQTTIDYFKGSFARPSLAAQGGFSTAKALDPAYASGCEGGETPVACEYRVNQPSVALILLGTGDQHQWQTFENRYRQIVEYTINQGIVPVLITKGDDLESIDNSAPTGYINNIIIRLSREYDVPLLDLRQAIAILPDRGMVADGFHYNSPPDGLTADFTGDHLLYGFNMRNLTALQMLEALRLYVLY